MLFVLTFISVVFAASNVNCPSAYCSKCDTTGCTACINDYVLDNGECKYCREAVANCKYAKNGICTECFTEYYALNGDCYEADVNCEEYKNGRCVECHDGYKLTDGV